MGRYTGPKCRLCRKEGVKLFIKGSKCAAEKCTMTKRPTIPGMHTRVSSKQSYYALQLREKQKVKRTYGILEKQFRRFFDDATKSKGVTGRTLMQLLERRLDNVIYRALLASSRGQARQFVRHGFIFINGKRVDIPSYLIKNGDSIEIKTTDKLRETIKGIIEKSSKERGLAPWLEIDKDNLKVKLLRLPEREDISAQVNEQLIVELYSK
jgi:small subunit ribosomal protein S4